MTRPPRQRPLDQADAAQGMVDLDAVRGSLLRLVERFRPADARGVTGSWVIDAAGYRPYTIHIRDGRCLVSAGTPEDPTATLSTDARTWLDLVSGRQDGIAAFMAGKLRVEGDLNLAMRLETMFTPGPQASRLLRTVHTEVRGVEIESMVTGHGTPVLLLHGLAANKMSFMPTFDGLASRYEVHALDLPGHGKSGKPLPHGRRYSMPWMAEIVRGYLIRNRIREAYLVGNSMGGRIATEVALRHPRVVRGTIGLGAAVAFDEWQRLATLMKLVQYQWVGLAPTPRIRRSWLESGMSRLFHDPTTVPQDNLRAGADDVLRSLKDRGYRLAVTAAARHLASERATGKRGYWDRLENLQVPSLWIWGDRDRLVSHRYAERVTGLLPHAQVEVWKGIGHVPQFEAPERTTKAVADFLDRIEAGY